MIRNRIWDHLHGYAERTPARDVDVAYFDATDSGKESELAWERRLRTLRPDVPWEVKNQAAVHLWLSSPGVAQDVPRGRGHIL